MPSGALLAARLVLAVVFLTAGRAKLVDREGSRQALTDFGLPRRLVPAASILLPAVELGVAVALVVAPAARAGAVAALALLGAFTVAIAVSLALGRSFECHCFGQAGSSPIGAGSLVRNLALGALSSLVAWQGAGMGIGDALARIGDLSSAGRVGLAVAAVLALAVAVEGWLILQLVHQQGRLLLRLEVLEDAYGDVEGTGQRREAPSFRLPSLTGDDVSLDELTAGGRPALLLFTSPRCGPCTTLLPEIGHWQQQYGDRVAVAVLARGDVAANREKAARHRIAPVLLDTDGAVADAYRAQATPSGVIVGADHRLRSLMVAGAAPIRGLLVRAVDARAEVVGRHVHGHNGNNAAPGSAVEE